MIILWLRRCDVKTGGTCMYTYTHIYAFLVIVKDMGTEKDGQKYTYLDYTNNKTLDIFLNCF